MKSVTTAISLMLAMGLVGCSDDEKATEEVCRPGGTCSTTSSACAYDKECPSPGETCGWTQSADRFADNGNGTVTDRKTCLTWEKKTGTPGSSVDCASAGVAGCENPHDVNNRYTWSTATTFDGTAASVFLKQLNDARYGGHNDWRLPASAGEGATPTGGDPELESIVSATDNPRIYPIFGPTAARDYWSSSQMTTDPSGAWLINFFTGELAPDSKTSFNYVRAVRGGPGT